jgi:hypothetical protein
MRLSIAFLALAGMLILSSCSKKESTESPTLAAARLSGPSSAPSRAAE